MRDDKVLAIGFRIDQELRCAGDCGNSVTIPSLVSTDGEPHPQVIWWGDEGHPSKNSDRQLFSDGMLYTMHHDYESGVVAVPYTLRPTRDAAGSSRKRLPAFGTGANQVIWVCRSCVKAGFAINSEMQRGVRAEMEEPRAFPSLREFRKAV